MTSAGIEYRTFKVTELADEGSGYEPYRIYRSHYTAPEAGGVPRLGLGDMNLVLSAMGESLGDSGYKVEADFNGDGTVNLTDLNIHSAQGGESIARGRLSGSGNIVGYAGYLFEPATGMYVVRHRWYSTENGRWLSRDPLGYVDGQSEFQYANSSPVGSLDASGLTSTSLYGTKEGAMSLRLKQYWIWNERIRKKPGSWFRTVVEQQQTDFLVSFDTSITIQIQIGGRRGPRQIPGGPGPAGRGNILPLHWERRHFLRPRSKDLNHAIRSNFDRLRNLEDKACSKYVFVEQECCVSGSGGPTYEKRYTGVTLVGETVIEFFGISDPETGPVGYLRCDVSDSMRKLNGYIQSLNAGDHDMCKDGLPGRRDSLMRPSDLPEHTAGISNDMPLKLWTWKRYKQ